MFFFLDKLSTKVGQASMAWQKNKADIYKYVHHPQGHDVVHIVYIPIKGAAMINVRISSR